MDALAGKTAVVTGAASGIGLATARAFAAEGMKVVLADVEEGALAKAEAELQGDGHEVCSVRTDVSSWDDVQALAERTVARFGAVHVVFNNAGVVTAGPTEELSLADWEWVLGVDLWGVIYGVKAFVPLIKQAGEGHVVNTASIAGLVASASIAPYNVAKFGVVALTETLARELDSAGSAIGASVLCPGPVDTAIVTSERNRPVGATQEHRVTPQEEAFMKGSTTLLGERGLKPVQVADLVVQGIRENRFWILPHPRWLEPLRDRVASMLSDGTLR